jgi:hypothetical protein
MAIVQTATNAFKVGMLNGTFNFTTGAFKMALYTGKATLGSTTAAYTSSNEASGGNYVAGGTTITVTQTPTTGTSGTVAYISFSNAAWTGAITARGALIYQVGGGNPAVCVLDFGADKSSSKTFTVQFPAVTNTSAIIRIA